MASAGFVADFGRRPVGVKLGVLALVLAVLLTGWYVLFYSKLQKDIEAAKQAATDLNNQKTKLAKDEARYDELDEQQKRLKTLIAENDNALPTAAQLPAFFDMLNRKIGEAGVTVRKWDYQKEVSVEETIYKVPVQIEISGSYYQIEKFFYLLYKVNQKEGDEGGPAPGSPAVDTQERDRILTIEDLDLHDPVVENGELIITATFRASTFRKEVPAAPAPEDDKKKAGTPAGGKNPVDKAKAKTDDAMKKDADRVKEGM